MMGNIVAKPKKLTADDNTIVFETESPLPEFSRYYFTVASDHRNLNSRLIKAGCPAAKKLS